MKKIIITLLLITNINYANEVKNNNTVNSNMNSNKLFNCGKILNLIAPCKSGLNDEILEEGSIYKIYPFKTANIIVSTDSDFETNECSAMCRSNNNCDAWNWLPIQHSLYKGREQTEGVCHLIKLPNKIVAN